MQFGETVAVYVLETCAVSIIRVDPDNRYSVGAPKKDYRLLLCHHILWKISVNVSKTFSTSIFRVEDVGSTFRLNLFKFLPEYRASYPRRVSTVST
jgi:hypothetical protein